jgi:hypothetical protein
VGAAELGESGAEIFENRAGFTRRGDRDRDGPQKRVAQLQDPAGRHTTDDDTS